MMPGTYLVNESTTSVYWTPELCCTHLSLTRFEKWSHRSVCLFNCRLPNLTQCHLRPLQHVSVPLSPGRRWLTCSHWKKQAPVSASSIYSCTINIALLPAALEIVSKELKLQQPKPKTSLYWILYLLLTDPWSVLPHHIFNLWYCQSNMETVNRPVSVSWRWLCHENSRDVLRHTCSTHGLTHQLAPAVLTECRERKQMDVLWLYVCVLMCFNDMLRLVF